jgi:hypothetical protein
VPTPLETSTLAVGDLSSSTIRPVFGDDRDLQSTELETLVERAMETAVEYLFHGGLLVPTLLTETEPASPVGPSVRLFGDPMSFETDFDAALRTSRRVVDCLPSDVIRYVWVYDGYAGHGAGHSDAIVMEAAERNARHGWRLAVRYRLNKSGITLADERMVVVGAVGVPLCGVSV